MTGPCPAEHPNAGRIAALAEPTRCNGAKGHAGPHRTSEGRLFDGTHAERAAVVRSAVPCAAWHLTFGGRCLNCGYAPMA